MSWRRRFPRLFGPDAERDVDEEIEFHLEMRLRERLAAGEDPGEARDQVLRRFGDVAAARSECVTITERRGRSMRRRDYASELGQDIGYAVRSLRRRPSFAILAIITLALGIGANSAIFSVVNGVLLESLPYADADRLMVVETEYTNGSSYELSAPDFMSVQEDARVFTEVAALSQQMMTLTDRGEPAEVVATIVSKGLFELLGIAPIVGRTFTEDEHIPGGGDRVVLTEGFARRIFGEPARSLEQTLTLAGRAFTVVGVMPDGTEAPEGAELYRPLPYDSTFSAQTALGRRGEFLTVIGRMRAGVTPALVEQDVRRLGAELADRFPTTNGAITLTSIPLTQVLIGDVRTPLLVLLGAVGLVLLVACANVANLLLARATAREGELAVRAALGAGRSRLVRQLLTESLVLAGAGAALGLLLAWGGTRALVAAQPADIPRLASIRISGTVVAFTAAIAMFTGLLFGALPALQATGTRMMQALRESGRGALSSARGQHIRAALVIAELGLAVMLLVGAGLLIRSFVAMTRVDTGFDTTNAVAFRVSLQGPSYTQAETRRRFFADLEDRLRAIPGVMSVGAASGLPMTDMVSLLGPFQVDGVEVPAGVLPEIRVITVTPEYFATLGTPLLMGRALNDRDVAESPPVVLFNHAAIARWFAEGDPVGERVRLGGSTREVVGIVGDVLQRAPGIPVEPEMYVPYTQRSGGTMRFVVRGRSDMAPIAARIRSAVHALDPQLPIASVDPLDRLFADAVARPRFYTTLLTLFAGVALALAVIGIFGVMSYLVAQRSHEISIRMALGADRAAVVGMIVGRAMTVAAAGLVAGVAGAMAVSGVLRSQLFGIDTTDPITLGAVLVILGASALFASLLPALRASRLDPGAVLREG